MKNSNFYHLCIRRKDQSSFCLTEFDYDLMVKSIALSSIKYEVGILAYCVMSNHLHILIETQDKIIANKFSIDVLTRYSKVKHLSGNDGFRRNTSISIKAINNDAYLRNTIAYIINNAKDNGCEDVLSYRWSSARSLFHIQDTNSIPLSEISFEKKRIILHSRIPSNKIIDSWLINQNGELEPRSICSWVEAEKVFASKTDYLNCINNVNMNYIWKYNVDLISRKLSDYELYVELNKFSQNVFHKDISKLYQNELRVLINKALENYNTTTKQLQRICCFK